MTLKAPLLIHGADHCPGGKDPIPCLGPSPWVALHNGATTVASGTWKPVPLGSLAYDPDLVTPGDIFSWASTDVGDTGNPRWELTTHRTGWYSFELVTAWDQVTTAGGINHGYAVQQLRFTPGLNSPFFENTFLSSADWLDNVYAPSGFEMLDNPTLMTARKIYVASGRAWQPRARQVTGATRGLSGVMFLVEYLGADDSATWTYVNV